MPVVVQDVIEGAIKVKGVADRVCVSTLQEFLTLLPDLLSVVVPTSVSGIIVSSTAPAESDINKIWVRTDGSGRFLGLYIFQQGSWTQIYDVISDKNVEIRWVVGSSANPPAGWTFITTGDSVIPSGVVTVLQGLYVPNGSGGFSYYAVRYSGF